MDVTLFLILLIGSLFALDILVRNARLIGIVCLLTLILGFPYLVVGLALVLVAVLFILATCQKG